MSRVSVLCSQGTPAYSFCSLGGTIASRGVAHARSIHRQNLSGPPPPPPKTQRDRHYLERILFCPSRNSQVAPRLFFLLISHVDSVLSTLRNCYVFPRNILSPPCQRRAAVFLIKISISSQVRFLYVFLLNTKKGFGQTFNSHRIPQCREPLRCRHNKLLTRLLVSRSTGWRPRRQ